MDRRDDGESWEYKVRRPTRDGTKKEASKPEGDLNELAADGWRFVETIDYSGGGTKFLVFERPVPADGTDAREDGEETPS